MTPIVSRPKRRCVRCGLIAQLDRAGHCKFCQYEQATWLVYINWERFSAAWHARGWTWDRAA